MMNDAYGNKVIGVMLFILGIALLYFGGFMITALADAQLDTVSKVFFWVGFVIMVISTILIKPFLAMYTDQQINLPVLLQGVLWFFMFSILNPAINNILDSIFGGEFFQTYTDVNSGVGLGYVLILALGFIIVPMYFVVST